MLVSIWNSELRFTKLYFHTVVFKQSFLLQKYKSITKSSLLNITFKAFCLVFVLWSLLPTDKAFYLLRYVIVVQKSYSGDEKFTHAVVELRVKFTKKS